MNYTDYPRPVVEDIARLRRCIQTSGIPTKDTDQNLIIGTWNIKVFSSVYPGWDAGDHSPKRDWRALAVIVEVVRRFDVLAIQEVRGNTSGLHLLLDWLGPNWGVILTDTCSGDEGNDERLVFIFDRRRVQPSGLAGEIVLPTGVAGEPTVQFSRTPYIVGFQAGSDSFSLLTAHIKYGKSSQERTGEIQALTLYIEQELRVRAKAANHEETNLIVLGDFNIDERGDNPLFQAFIATGLQVPPQLMNLSSAFGAKPKYYDQIAWFMGEMNLNLKNAGVIDFSGAVFPELKPQQMAYRISDHLPLWCEFSIDHSSEQMAHTLGIDPAMPDPLSTVPG